jgi:quercetin dioxygenase-like cupin family protein
MITLRPEGRITVVAKGIDRRSALSLGLAATALAVTTPALAQAPQGVSRQSWGKRDSMIPGYKSVSMRDVIYQPGAKTSNPSMSNDMVCHVPEGELRVKQSNGAEFIAKKGDVWTCKKGIGEDLENVGSTVAIMRIIDLIPA